MANFKTHVTVAAVVGLISSLGAHLSGISVTNTMSLAFICTCGGILPDIDSQNSTSRTLIYNIIGIISFIFILFITLKYLGILLSLFLSLIIYCFIVYPIKEVIGKFCVHRGIVHSIPMGLILSLLLTFIFYLITKDEIISWLSGIFLFLGYLVHVILDEIYSVDLSGARLKKSFGTACTLFSSNNIIGYLVMYTILVVAIILIPEKVSFFNFIHNFFTNVSTNIWKNLLPDFYY